jgi:hypothetical protein
MIMRVKRVRKLELASPSMERRELDGEICVFGQKWQEKENPSPGDIGQKRQENKKPSPKKG